ncbi:hypothetical protein A9Y87_05700 [Salmonella enterica subsp. enterica]|nr:hypothetical protein A9Y87_05700 [Salmonella enterica subsp. enterica]
MPKKKLETEGCRCNDLTFCAPETAVGLEAAGDVFAVEQIINVNRNAGPAIPKRARSYLTTASITAALPTLKLLAGSP